MPQSNMKDTTFLKLSEIEQFLDGIPQFVEGTGVQRGRKLLAQIGNPEESFKIIHVAGTNGKGSVCSYISEVLTASGYKTGLFTSPHLKTMRERIRIDGRIISEEDFVKYFNEIYNIARSTGLKLAYFDYFLGIAMLYYKAENVDFCVLETGLGGKLDATNAIASPVLTVITTISLEHTAILGDTIAKIASEKAGIIKKNVPVVYQADNKEASQVIENEAGKSGAVAIPVSSKDYTVLKLHFDYENIKNSGVYIDFLLHNEYYKNDCIRIGTTALYQVENCSLALTAIGVLKENNIISINEETLKNAVANTHWAGRMEALGHNIYVDGAHNPQGIKAFTASVQQMLATDDDKNNKHKAVLMFSVVSDKNYKEMVRTLCESGCFKEYVITCTGGARKRSLDTIKKAFEEYKESDSAIAAFDDFEEAFNYVKCKDELVFCTGSLYLTGDIEKILTNNEQENKAV